MAPHLSRDYLDIWKCMPERVCFVSYTNNVCVTQLKGWVMEELPENHRQGSPETEKAADTSDQTGHSQEVGGETPLNSP